MGHQLPSPSPQALGGVPLAFCLSGFDCSEIIVKVVGNLHVLMMSFLHRQMLFLRFCNPALVSGEVVSLSKTVLHPARHGALFPSPVLIGGFARCLFMTEFVGTQQICPSDLMWSITKTLSFLYLCVLSVLGSLGHLTRGSQR